MRLFNKEVAPESLSRLGTILIWLGVLTWFMQILNLCLTFLIFVMSYVSLFLSQEMLTTNLGKNLLVAFALFWFLRMLEQIFLFEVKGRLSAVFTVIFLLGCVLYILPVVFYTVPVL